MAVTGRALNLRSRGPGARPDNAFWWSILFLLIAQAQMLFANRGPVNICRHSAAALKTWLERRSTFFYQKCHSGARTLSEGGGRVIYSGR